MSKCFKCGTPDVSAIVCCDPQCPQALAVMNMTNAARKFVTGEDRLTEVEYTFVDDHVLGCVVAFGVDKVRVAFPCCGWELTAAFQYAIESDSAYNTAKAYVDGELATGDNGEFYEMHETNTWDTFRNE